MATACKGVVKGTFCRELSGVQIYDVIMNESTENKNRKPFWLRVTLNILLMIVIGCFLLWISTFVLDLWTRHGDNVTVPDVKGMHFDDASRLLEDNDFEVVLQDSVYEDGVAPGTVVDQNPKDSVEVKPGRTIYLTINAFYPRTVSLPALTDISLRQARTILEGLGVKNIKTKEVPSEYQDLVFAALYNGKRLKPGERVPLTAQITLEVGVALDYDDMRVDTLNYADGMPPKQDVSTSAESGQKADTPSNDSPEAASEEPAAQSEPSDDSDDDLFD